MIHTKVGREELETLTAELKQANHLRIVGNMERLRKDMDNLEVSDLLLTFLILLAVVHGKHGAGGQEP